ncbi:hypothetical protein [Paenibacillus sp. JJ-223]|uniref:hypothetical protein n=1 Tax=Paenibacillus sp. JJ-223 TaxID=2905647 RepID=UPI001F162BCD|nr:hypothetical protein [Paenibacillus sp. JJ-223]CAH1216020.1 hypothetical protein PAECIP111890_04336 [Paenibacillus sp. JJ-223]
MKNSVRILHHSNIDSLEKLVNNWLHEHVMADIKSIQYHRESNSHVAVIWYEG